MRQKVNIMAVKAAATKKRDESEKEPTAAKPSNLKMPKQTPSHIQSDVETIQIRLSELGDVKKSPLELDLEIQAQRVLHVLDSAIETLEVVVWLPLIVKKGRPFLEHYFPDEEIAFILTTCTTYLNPDANEWTPDEISILIDDIRKTVSKRRPYASTPTQTTCGGRRESTGRRYSIQSQRSRGRKFCLMEDGLSKADPHLSYVVELLCGNDALRRCLKKQYALEESHAMFFLQQMKRLRQIAESKLAVTAVQEAEREKMLKWAWKKSSEGKDEFLRLTEQVSKQRVEMGEQLLSKQTMMVDYQNKISELQVKFEEDIRKAVQESEKGMAEDNEDSSIRQTELNAEAENVKQRYQALLNENLRTEKNLRARKFKIETQLAGWLAKYDQDVGDRNAEYEQLMKEFNAETDQMNELQEKFDEQSIEYNELMAEKEAEEQKIFEEMAYQFLLNRSARRIQRCWRAYKERKLARKKARKAKAKQKGKKGKKGKQPPEKKDENVIMGRQDPNALLQQAFKGDILADVKPDSSFTNKEIVVDLTK